MNGFVSDCRHALRLYSRTPVAVLIALTVLGTGIAFVVAFLSLYADLVLRPHPGFEQSGRIATFSSSTPYGVVERMAEEMTSLDSIAQLQGRTALIGIDAEASVVTMASPGFFEGLRPRLELGRGFLAEEHAPDAAPVAVLSYRYWQQRFGGDRGVLDTTVTITREPGQPYYAEAAVFPTLRPELDGESADFRIVGVLAESMSDTPWLDATVWVPIEQGFPLLIGELGALSRFPGFTLLRREDGASVQAVLNEFNARYSGDRRPAVLSEAYAAEIIEGVVPNFAVQRAASRQLGLFLIGSLLIALAAAINVSLFLLSRAPARRRELGIRLAAGAPMSRLARQLATESGLFVAMAAGLGVLVSFWLATVLRGLPLVREAQWIDVQVLDWRVLAFTAAVIVILGLIVSLAPIAAVRRLGIAQSSQHAVSRASLAQGFANSAQIALAGTIGGAAIAFGWYLAPMMFGDQGFTLANRFLVQQAGYIRNTIEAEASVELPRRREFIEAIPGVERVAFGYPVPGDDTMRPARRVTNEFGAEIEYRTGMLSHDLVELLGIRMVYGRAPTEEEPRALAVNQAFARAYWGRDDVVGERLPQFSNAGAAITGVLEDFAFGHPAEPVEPFVFEFHYYGDISLDAVLESRLTVAELQPEIDRLIAEGSLELPWSTVPVRSLRSTRNELIAADRARGVLTIVAASVVLGLAGFGIYGTQRYLVAAGRREYAIRAAVGAGPASLGRLVLRRGLMLGLPGMAVGGLLSFIAVAWLGDEFLSRDVAPAIVTGWVVGGLVLLLLLASLSPAREAKRIQAAEQLRDG